ncbi:hypothetical protein NBZ79_12640 [Sneathiella marina]|uniref:Uncharacterized protein n=1 Tax=Sneathiella marina TaxID=2950108 RepID=A0ABY4W2S1_9PROT|nr:hypothetical protein [Sneathiella marina]USG60025.1 hypothetical protein NBZ79_12640 [Sneathiella marina]
MRQAEHATIVSDLKSEILAVGSPDKATVGERANAANLAALDMLIEGTDLSSGKKTMLAEAQTLRDLSREVREMTQVIDDLSCRTD